MRKYLLLIPALFAVFLGQARADSTVSAMTAASALAGTELLYCVQSAADRKCTPSQMGTYIYGLASGDCTITGPGVVTCTKTNGAAFGAPATAAFGTAAGTVAQGGVITAGGPTGSATVAPIITYNAAGQLTTVSSATVTPAVGSVTGLGTGVATALGVNIGTAGGALVKGTSVCADLSNGTTNCSAAVGQLPGTTTNDNATAGNVGEIIASFGHQSSGTVTISNASPAVITDATTCTTNQRTGCVGIGNVVNFTTTGALPAGLSTGTNYYILAAGFVAGTSYEVATTPFGTPINTTNAGSGTQTRVNTTVGVGSNSAQTVAAVSLTAGDWSCSGLTDVSTTGTTTTTAGYIGTTNNSLTGRITESNFIYIVGTGLLSGIEAEGTSGPVPISLSGTTTYYLETLATFSTGTGQSSGSLICRRAR